MEGGEAVAGSSIPRPNTAPTYYQGRPADLWIAALSPRRKRSASNHPMQTVTGGRAA
jgi:hypothetical protein